MTTYIPSITLPAFAFAQPAVAVLLPIALGTGIGYSISPKKDTQETYLALKQPPLRPPPAVFGPVWTVLYGSMGFAAYRAWSTAHESMSPRLIDLARHGATLYTIQLGLNLIWMPLFFRLKRPIEASVDIVALTGVTAYLTSVWGQVDERAGWALAPYLAWLSFASYLCIGAGYLNNWNFADKERRGPPPAQGSGDKYVNEKNE